MAFYQLVKLPDNLFLAMIQKFSGIDKNINYTDK
jgi:hypothetical protein